LEACTTGRQRAVSSDIKRAKSGRLAEARGTLPLAESPAASSGSASLAMDLRCRRFRIGSGMFAGAAMQNQPVDTISNPASRKVGTSAQGGRAIRDRHRKRPHPPRPRQFRHCADQLEQHLHPALGHNLLADALA